MAIKGGDILHVGNTVLLERAQTAGPGQVNLNPEKVYELGNYQSVATIYDIPDLSFNLESIDASAALEALLIGEDFGTMAASTQIDLGTALPLDVVGQLKPGKKAAAPFDVVGSIAAPYLTLESLSYRFGLRDKAAQTATLRGDSIFYNPGAAVVEEVAGTATANQVITLANPAYPFNGDVSTGVRYALAVCLGSGKRLTKGVDYTEAPTGVGPAKDVDVTIIASVPTTDVIRIVYATDATVSYPQLSHTVASATHPAAIRGRDIKVYVGGHVVANRWSNIQSVTADWRVNLERDEEFGSSVYVSQDYEVPDVNGTVVVRPNNPADLFSKIKTVAGLATSTEVAGALVTNPVELLIVLHSPADGSVLKSIQVPDARITVPGYSGTVQQKLDWTFNYDSDGGLMYVYKGLPATYSGL